MAKRLTDADKWKKPFIRGLKGPYKLLWFYILDDCNHAGIWQVDLEVAALRVGEQIDRETAEDLFKENIIIFDNGEKWFIPDFIEFQYGTLNPLNRVHKSVIDLLEKYQIKDLTRPLQRAKDKDKDKVKDKEKDLSGFEEFWDLYDKKRGRPKCERLWVDLSQAERDLAMAHIPVYKQESPDRKFRKDPERYLAGECWNNQSLDEPVASVASTQATLVNPVNFFNYADYVSACTKKSIDPISEEAYINAGKGIKPVEA